MIKFNNLNIQNKLIKKNILKNINKVFKHGKYIMGPEINKLEKKLAKFIGSKYCVSVSSGTDALLISMKSIGIQKNDEVITTPFSYFATTEVILQLGAKPVYVDIEEDTFNIDPKKIEEKINSRTKLVMPVSLFGQCANFSEIEKISNKYKIPIIEDAAQSFGATHNNKKSCNFGLIGCTSFFPTKPLGCYGDGGACFTNNKKIADKIRKLRVHGQEKTNFHSYVGYNARLDSIQAAVLLAKLKIFSKELIQRKIIAKNYDRLIKKTNPSVIIPLIDPLNKSVYAQYTIRLKKRIKFINKFKKNNIPFSIYYPLIASEQKVFSKNKFYLPVAKKISKEVFSLPMHPYLKLKEQIKIIKLLKI